MLYSPAARILGFEKVLLMVQKKNFALRAKTPTKHLLVASGGETHVPQARSEFLRINDICSFPLTRLYIVLYGGRPQAVVVSAFLSVSSGHDTQRFLAKPRYATFKKKCSHIMELRWWWELLAPQAHGTQLFFLPPPDFNFFGTFEHSPLHIFFS